MKENHSKILLFSMTKFFWIISLYKPLLLMDFILCKYDIIKSEVQYIKTTGLIKAEIIVRGIEMTLGWFMVS